MQAGIQKLREAMAEAGCETLGEYLCWRHARGLTLKLKNEGLYAHRLMVEDEFDRIWQVQEAAHPVLRSAHEGEPWRQVLHRYVFHQRPLRSPAPMVGHCELEPTLPRSPKAQPVFQEFRILRTLNDLAWSDGSPLTESQRAYVEALLRDPAKLNRDGTISFDRVYRELRARNTMHPDGLALNLDAGPRRHLMGDRTRKTMSGLELLDVWDALDEHAQIQVINLLAEMGSPEVFEDPDWAKNLRTPTGKPRRLRPEAVAFIDRMAAHPRFGRLAAMGFDPGRAAYSVKAMKRMIPLMRQVLKENEAKDRLYPGWRRVRGEERELKDALPPHPA
ncbi:MAG: hypothetical protein D6794_07240, partial [Deltaproteobacteria bacterium]